MRWFKKTLDVFFKKLYLMFTGLFLSVLVVLLITMSAQLLGNRISNFILNNKTVETVIIAEKDSKEYSSMEKLAKIINEDYDLRDYNIKTTLITKEKGNDYKKNKGKIVISTQKELFDNFVSRHKISILERAIFSDRNKIYLEFSQYDDYVFAETVIDNTKIYIGIIDVETNLEKIKINKTLSAICDSILKKTDLQPEI